MPSAIRVVKPFTQVIPWGSLLIGLVVGVALQLQQVSLYEGATYALAMFVAATGVVLVLALPQKRFLPIFPAVAGFLLAAFLTFGLTGLRAGAFQKTAIGPTLEGKDLLIVGQELPCRSLVKTACGFASMSNRPA